MLLCQNAQTFNLEGSLVSSPGPHSPTPVNWPVQKKVPCTSEHIGHYRGRMCSLLKT